MEALRGAGARLWKVGSSDQRPLVSLDIVRDAAGALAELIQNVPKSGEYTEVGPITVSLGEPAVDVEMVSKRERNLKVAEILAASGLVSAHAIAYQECVGVTVALQTELSAQEPASPIVSYVLHSAPVALSGLEDSSSETRSRRAELISSVGDCEWLPELERTWLSLHCRTIIKEKGNPGVSNGLPTADDIVRLASDGNNLVGDLAHGG